MALRQNRLRAAGMVVLTMMVVVAAAAVAPAGAAGLTVAGMRLGTSTVAGCKNVTATVTLSGTAPKGGAVVALRSTNPAAVVPATVLVPVRKKVASFTVRTVPVSEPTIASIEATLGGVTRSAALTVRPMEVTAVTLRPTIVNGAETAWARAQLECAAGPGGVTVRVGSDDRALAQPTVNQIQVPPGRWEGYFMVAAAPAAASTTVGITATAGGGATRRAALQVTGVSAVAPVGYRNPEAIALFNVLDVYEGSGIEVSVANPGYVYLLDDGPATTEVWAVRLSDSSMRRLELADFTGADTEDLAVAPCDASSAQSCLYIGDIGDNQSRRASVRVLRLVEPDLSQETVAALPWTAITLKYPGGARNAETLLVDDAGAVFTVTKSAGTDGTGAARLFGRPSFTSGTMTDYGAVPVPLPAVRWTGKQNVVTGGDVKDGSVILRTYDHVVEYRGVVGASLATFASWPAHELPAAREPQGEAITYAPGCGYLTISEMVGDVFAVACDLPTEEPTEEPTDEPTEAPTQDPTEDPTEQPTDEVTLQPTEPP